MSRAFFIDLTIAVLIVHLLILLTIIAYMAVSPLARLKEQPGWSKVWWAWKLAGVICLVVGYPGDVLFNALYGTVIFAQPPRQLTFSSRVQEQLDHGSGDRHASAVVWGSRLNRIWPGHIRGLKP